MKALFASLNVLVLCLPLIGWASPAPSPAAVAGPEPREASLIDRLPDRALVAVEVRDFSRRWPEIAQLPGIRQAMDAVLRETGLAANELPGLIGNRAVFTLVPAEDGRSLIPVGLLRPPAPGKAEARLAQSGLLASHRDGTVLWVAPARFADGLEALARGDGTSLGKVLSRSEVDARLPRGGLVRGWLHAPAVREWLRARVPEGSPAPSALIASMLAAELELVEYAGFRRDIVSDGVVVDGVISYDTTGIPPEVARVLNPSAAPVVLPSSPPQGLVLMSAFRPEPKANMPWLRHIQASDPRGPMRNLDFWAGEFAARTGKELERDLFGSLGERGWFAVFESRESDCLNAAIILEATDPARVEETLVALRDWYAEQAAGRSLGLWVPRPRESRLGPHVVHGLDVWTPLFEIPGPVFLTSGPHLVAGTSAEALDRSLELLRDRESWTPVPVDPDLPGNAHAAVLVNGPALGRWVGTVSPLGHEPLGSSVAAILGDLRSVGVGAWYEDDSVRVRGRVRLARN